MADEFDEFVSAGEVEVGKPADGIESTKDGVSTTPKPDEKPAAKTRPPRQAEAPAKAPKGDDDDDSGEENDENEDDEDEDEEKPRKTAKDHQIERLKREKRDLQRQLREGGANSKIEERLASLETRLTGENTGDSKTTGKAPDPTDLEKYPLGHLDDRYIEDKLEWLADQKATKTADTVLQREQERERTEAFKQAQAALLDQVDDLAAKGADLYPDFQEEVVEAGMRGDWDLSQATFEAAAEAENGAQILYELSQDKKEARRVAKLSNYQQMKFVQERDAELASGKKGRTKPQAGDPPRNQPRGANSRTEINPATDNLDDFEKAWERDEKKSKR